MCDGRGDLLQIVNLIEHKYNRSQPATVQETSKSWLFLTRDHVFKLKKKVRDDLQDLTSLRARLDNSLTENDLNRRLAPRVYLGIIPVVERSDGRLNIGGAGEVIDWLVKMDRLPADRMLDVILETHPTDPQKCRTHIEALSRTLVEFYRSAPVSLLNAGELATNMREQQQLNRECLLNAMFAQHHARFQATFDALDRAATKHFPSFESRVKAGWIRECHGDLRPEHICLVDPPVVFDCLEFNRNLRLVDPFSEVMFLGLEAAMLGAAWIKPFLIDRLLKGLGTGPDPDLLQLYEALHALLRTRLCLAHLLVPTPRKPEKWMPLGLRYFEVAERLLCGPAGLGS